MAARGGFGGGGGGDGPGGGGYPGGGGGYPGKRRLRPFRRPRLWRRAARATPAPATAAACLRASIPAAAAGRRSGRRPRATRRSPAVTASEGRRRRRRRRPGSGTQYSDGLTGLMAVNLIRAHREELIQASTGKLDHMVIDVVGSLFDQILSDSRVPPQMAREIARLQLPVLRVALNDSSFFSTRRHPVRRFINRIASLANAFDDFDDGPGAQFLHARQEAGRRDHRRRLRPDRALRRQGHRARELHRATRPRARSSRSRARSPRSRPRSPSCGCSSATCCSCSRRSGRCRCRPTCRSSWPRSGARRWCSRCAATAPIPIGRGATGGSAPTW